MTTKKPVWDGWDEAADSKLRELHAQGKGDKAIEKALGCGSGLVTRRRNRLGLLPNGTLAPATRAGVEKRTAEKRDQLRDALLADVIALRERLWSEHETVVGGPNGPEKVRLDIPDAKATNDLAAAIDRLLKSYQLIDRIGGARATDVAKAALTKLQEDLVAFVQADGDD